MNPLTWSKLKELSPCPEALAWGKEKYDGQESQDSLQVINDLMEEKKLDWANWLLVHLMTRPQYLAYAIYAAEQVIDIFEREYPNDNRPRKALEAAQKVLKEDTEENRKKANETASAAFTAAYLAANEGNREIAYETASTAFAMTYLMTFAACSITDATHAANAAAYSAYAVGDAASTAAYLATDAAIDVVVYAAEKEKMLIKILDYGIELIKKEK